MPGRKELPAQKEAEGRYMEKKRKGSSQARHDRVKKRKQKIQYKQNRAGMLCVSCIVLFVLAAFSIQIVNLHRKDEAYKAQELELESRLAEEQERQEEIEEYTAYVNTPEYIEQLAKAKLGLVYPNEIVFKEQETEE